MKLAFVILQYMAADDTAECVRSIRAHAGVPKGEYAIAIVDNASPDGSYERTRDRFKEDEDVALLRSEENLGFARGNNLGYRYARERWAPEYIVLLNSDVVLFQDNLYEVLCDGYLRHAFAVMGPMILTADGSYTSSPMIADGQTRPDSELVSAHTMERSIRQFERMLLLLRLHLYQPVQRIYRILRKKEAAGDPLYLREQVNVRLHGAFLVFSRQYQEVFPDGLDERTFLYDEEYFLQYHVIRAGLSLLYSPYYCVYHKEDASANAAYTVTSERKIFQLTQMIRSRRQYLQMLEEDEAKPED